MGGKDRAFDDIDPEEMGDYIPVVYGRCLEEAEKYRQLLEDHDVPAIIDEEYEPGSAQSPGDVTRGVPVLVPESLLDEARAYIAGLEEMNELVVKDDNLNDDDDEFGADQGFELDRDDEQQ